MEIGAKLQNNDVETLGNFLTVDLHMVFSANLEQWVKSVHKLLNNLLYKQLNFRFSVVGI